MEPTHEELDAAGAAADLARYRVIDVREPHEFHGPLGRIGGAELVPLAMIDGLERDPSDDRPLLLVCRSGRRSATACTKLAARGFQRPTNLVGGMIGWNRAGLPLSRTPTQDSASLAEAVIAWSAQINARPPERERETLSARLPALALDVGNLDRKTLESLIGLVEATFQSGEAPPDLDLAIGAFRRSLAAL